VVDLEIRKEQARHYNFEVEDFHTYFVSETKSDPAVWVHNTGCLDRSQSQLISNLGGLDKGYAAHHLIPVSSVGKFSGLFKKAKSLGFNINRGTNGMALPTSVKLSRSSGLPLHKGGHLGSYFAYVDKQLASLNRRWKSGAVGDDQILRQLNIIERRVRKRLKDRKLFLQNADPHQ
tara:strand:+ start:4503 stop:5030 length:528 start_codon:yes stop_codon:yes gene_type:complete